jgi:hypothetical protein
MDVSQEPLRYAAIPLDEPKVLSSSITPICQNCADGEQSFNFPEFGLGYFNWSIQQVVNCSWTAVLR